ncbi:MAG: SURF1 family protein [Sphingomonadaceae bacterium]
MTGGTDNTGALPARGAVPSPRGKTLRISVAIIATLMLAGFFALGTWQLFRLQWKLALIERVEQRVHAAPQAAPAPAQWAQVSAERHEYLHVRVSGRYLPASATQVLASTGRGIGYWVLTPLCSTDGSIVMVNRGFVPAGAGGWKAQPAPPTASGPAACASASGEQVSVTGLLRLSETASHALRQNEPARNYWYGRDLQAIASARGLPPVAPYFIDADAAGEQPPLALSAAPQPLGGMTLVQFPNNHLVYAVTWFALALMMAAAIYWVLRDARHARPD